MGRSKTWRPGNLGQSQSGESRIPGAQPRESAPSGPSTASALQPAAALAFRAQLATRAVADGARLPGS